jgi:hypothetical protein
MVSTTGVCPGTHRGKAQADERVLSLDHQGQYVDENGNEFYIGINAFPNREEAFSALSKLEPEPMPPVEVKKRPVRSK